jgi:hypothetical protein
MVSGEVYAIAFSDDGTRLAAVGTGKDAFGKIVLTESGTK